MLTITRLFVIVGTLSVVGCGGGVPAEDLPEEFEQSLCENQVRCGAYPDMETCRASLLADDSSDLPELLELLEADRVDYDEGQARECLDLWKEANPDCTVFGAPEDFLDQLQEACSDVFTGDVEAGGTCYADEECAGDAECEISDCQDACCTGTCVAVQPEQDAALGEDCSGTTCVAGAYCNSDSVCAERHDVGETCEQFGSCVYGAACDTDSDTQSGTCVELPDEGETCDPDAFFGILACLRTDNWCDPADETCKPRLAVGDACDPQLDGCVRWAWCDESGTCAERPGEGGACDVELGPQCLGDFECVNGTCTAPEPDEICTDIPPAE